MAEESGWKVAFCMYVDSPQTAIVTDVRNDSWFSAEQRKHGETIPRWDD